jgi:protein involved in polysaccharide export with SLBB domain
VFSRNDIDFLNRTPVRRIVLGQANTLTECAGLDRLETLVRDSQTARFTVVTRSAFIVERAGQSDVAATGGNVGSVSRRGDEALRTGDDKVGLRGSNSNCPAVFEEEPELLPVLIENAVSVGGSVRRPGAYPVAGTISAADLAAVAEGVLSAASEMTLDVSRATGSTIVQERIATDGNPTALAETMMRAGDDLRFNAAQAQFEPGSVLLTGEFNRPGLYSIRKGETLSQLMARAGGLSSLAYPYGAIFTRRAVKELQQEGLRRTSRELTNGLLAVSTRKDASGDGLIAAQQLIQQLATVEAPGRMVVEADPRVLALRDDLDTVLESGDAIVMPKRPNFVLALGDVLNPGALQFVQDKPVGEYLRASGGTQSSADKGRIFVVLPNGSAQPLTGRGWGRSDRGVIPPGSTIIVPKNIDPLYKLDVARDIAGIVASLLTSVATVALLATK